jgi:hypothetical protein
VIADVLLLKEVRNELEATHRELLIAFEGMERAATVGRTHRSEVSRMDDEFPIDLILEAPLSFSELAKRFAVNGRKPHYATPARQAMKGILAGGRRIMLPSICIGGQEQARTLSRAYFAAHSNPISRSPLRSMVSLVLAGRHAGKNVISELGRNLVGTMAISRTTRRRVPAR